MGRHTVSVTDELESGDSDEPGSMSGKDSGDDDEDAWRAHL
jgi:hypothetical protein